MTTTTFAGMPDEGLAFLEDLEERNTKAFFDANRQLFKDQVQAPFAALVEAAAARLRRTVPGLGQPKVFRIYRDLRFSKDKTPYKLNCAAHLPGGYLSFSADELFVGSGLYMPGPDQLKRFRAAVDDGDSGSKLESIVSALRKNGYDVGAHEVLKTAPKGYPKDHPRIELLRYKGLITWKDWPAGAWLGTRRAKDRVIEFLQASKPMNEWLRKQVGRSTAVERMR